MKIVIFGLTKTGTTALFYKIKDSLPPDTICLFEPQRLRIRLSKLKGHYTRLVHRRAPDFLAKVLPFKPNDPPDADSFKDFDKQILIVRDPRDRLISKLLYGVYDSNFCHQDYKVKIFIEMLKQKETDPASVSLRRLLETLATLSDNEFSFNDWADAYRRHSIQMPLEFHDEHSKLFLYGYEDMVNCRFEGLEEYLGMTLEEGEASVGAEAERVSRTKTYGNWRDWFTSDDVEVIGPILQPFLNRYYPRADWRLAPVPSITPRYASGYVERIVNDRRALMKGRPFTQ